MSPTIRFRRWEVELYQRAIHVVRGPDRNCSRCNGGGGVQEEGPCGPEYDLCHCWDPAPLMRIPFWRRPSLSKEPF